MSLNVFFYQITWDMGIVEDMGAWMLLDKYCVLIRDIYKYVEFLNFFIRDLLIQIFILGKLLNSPLNAFLFF